jgi:hypothetical protein
MKGAKTRCFRWAGAAFMGLAVLMMLWDLVPGR